MKKTILSAVAVLLSMAATAQITRTPEGEMLKNMEWQSQGIYPDYELQQYVSYTETNAVAHVVINENKVYIKNPISNYKVGSWIEGELNQDGNEVVFHTPQAFTMENGTLWYVTRLEQNGSKLAVGESTDLVFSYEDGKLTQTDDGYIAITNLAGQWAGYADYNIVIAPVQEEVATPPTDAEILTYKMEYQGNGGSQSQTVCVAFSNDEVYIANPNGAEGSWIKGILQDDKIVCPNKQFLGADEQLGYYVYFLAAESKTEMVTDPYFGQVPVTNTYLTDDEAVTFTYNADDRSFATQQLFLVNPSKDQVANNYGYYNKASFTTFTEVAAVPANPSVTTYYGIIEGFGFGLFMIDMPNKDTEGNYINQDNMYYNLYFDNYIVETPEGLTDIPYNYTYGNYFQVSGTSHTYQYVNPINEKIGVQTFYKAGNVVNGSELIWYYVNGEDPNGIQGADTDLQPVRTEYFDNMGRKVAPGTKGLLIKRTTYNDGSQKTVKTVE